MQNTSEGAENRVYVHRYSPLQETLGEGFTGYCGVFGGSYKRGRRRTRVRVLSVNPRALGMGKITSLELIPSRVWGKIENTEAV